MPESLKDEIRDLELTVRELRLGLEEARAERATPAAASQNAGGSKKELSPLLLTIFGGIVTGIFAIANSYSQARQAHILEENKLRQSRQLEEDKLRSTLILKAIEPTDPNERKKALLFFVETGLLSDPDGKIGKIEAKDIPQASESIRTLTFRDGAILEHLGSAVVLQSGLAIDVDGSPRAYHPDGHSGLDFLANAGSPGNWWGVVTDDGESSGNPVIQGPSDPAPGFYISATALQDVTKLRTDPRRYVNSETIPYIVLPGSVLKRADEPKIGDLAAVLNKNNGRLSCAIVADVGAPRRLGEGSIALAVRLGAPSDPRSPATPGFAMVVFPGSGNGQPKTAEEIEAQGSKLFESWGGLKRLQAQIEKMPVSPSPSPTPSQ